MHSDPHNRPSPPAVRAGFMHAEAFNLMYYENEETGLGFLVFNPQDFVTPFCCTWQGREYRHSHFYLDRFLPGFIVPAGMFYFRPLTIAEAQQAAERRVEQLADTPHAVAAADRPRVLRSLADNFLACPRLDRMPPEDYRPQPIFYPPIEWPLLFTNPTPEEILPSDIGRVKMPVEIFTKPPFRGYMNGKDQRRRKNR